MQRDTVECDALRLVECFVREIGRQGGVCCAMRLGTGACNANKTR